MKLVYQRGWRLYAASSFFRRSPQGATLVCSISVFSYFLMYVFMFSIFRVYPKSFVSKKRVGYCFHPLRARAYLFFPYCRFWRTVTCVRHPAPGTYRLDRRLTEYISRLLEATNGRYGLCIADAVLFQETRGPLKVEGVRLLFTVFAF